MPALPVRVSLPAPPKAYALPPPTVIFVVPGAAVDEAPADVVAPAPRDDHVVAVAAVSLGDKVGVEVDPVVPAAAEGGSATAAARGDYVVPAAAEGEGVFLVADQVEHVVAGATVGRNVVDGGEGDVVVAGAACGDGGMEVGHRGGRDQVVAAAEVELGIDVLEADVLRVAEQDPLVRVRPVERKGAAAGRRGEGDVLVGRHGCAIRRWMVRRCARAKRRPDGRRASLEEAVPLRDRSLDHRRCLPEELAPRR
jgi:hypothetical protein